jgi:DNA-binding response OmpR family regulator
MAAIGAESRNGRKKLDATKFAGPRQRAGMSGQPELLCVGRDPVLNGTRELILAKCFNVTLADSAPGALALVAVRSFDLVLLCYSLTDDEGRVIVERVHALASPPRILALADGERRWVLGARDEEFMPPGPAELLARAVSMVGVSRAAAEGGSSGDADRAIRKAG